MEDINEINKELESISPLLSKMPKVNPFKVDEVYFDRLPMEVMDRIHASKPRKIFDLSWLLQPRWAAAMAACMIAIVFGSFLLFKNINADKPMPVAQVQQLLNQPVDKESVLDNVDTDDMIDAIANNEKAKTERKQLQKSVDKKAMEEYILDNVDESSITDQL